MSQKALQGDKVDFQRDNSLLDSSGMNSFAKTKKT